MATSKATSGDKGDKGDKGDTGATGQAGTDGQDGYTPVRGTDYWTTTDVTFIETYCTDYIDTQLENLNEEDF